VLVVGRVPARHTLAKGEKKRGSYASLITSVSTS
jgi:hypothetical protein